MGKIYLEYRSATKINAVRELARIELAGMASGEEERQKLPLFTGPNGAMLQRGDLAVMRRNRAQAHFTQDEDGRASRQKKGRQRAPEPFRVLL